MKGCQEGLLQIITDSVQDAIIVMDAKGSVSFWNPAAERMLHYLEQEALGQRLCDLICPENDVEEFLEKINHFIKSGQSPSINRITHQRVKRKDGTLLDVQVSLAPIKMGDKWGSVGILRDITAQKIEENALRESEERYRLLSMTDPLTGLYNRWHFKFELAKEVDRARRYSQPLSVLIFDIDDFKFFNDNFGHDVGDNILESIGIIVKNAVRVNDVACRIGGDEFFIILPMTPKNVAQKVAERISVELANAKFPFDERQVTVTTGVVQCEPDESVKDLVRRVDQLMYDAKKEGKNRVLVA